MIFLEGKPCWKLIKINDHPNADKHMIKTFFIIKMIDGGVLINSSHNVCYAHTAEDLEIVDKAYDDTLKNLSQGLENSSIISQLGNQIIRPIFSVR